MAPSKGWGDDQAAGDSTVITRIGPTRRNPVPNARPAAPPTPAGEGGSRWHELLLEISSDQASGESTAVTRIGPIRRHPDARPTPAAGEGGSGKHDLLPEMSGDQASGESTAVSRIGPTRRHPDARPTPAAGEGGSGRHDLLLEMSGAKGALADGFQEAVPTCGHHIDTARRLPTPVGQESTGLRVEGLLKCECDDDTQVDLSSGQDGFEDSVARCGYRNPTLVRRGYSTLTTPTRRRRGSHKATRRRRGSHKARGRGDGGGRRHRDAYNYDRTGTAPVLARTTDLLVPKSLDKGTYRASMVAGGQGDGGGRGDRDSYNYDHTNTAPVLAPTTDLLATKMSAERDGLKKSVARCGYHNPTLVRRDSTMPQRGLMPCALMGSHRAVAAGEQGDGGGRGDRDAYNYDRTSTASVVARTTDLLVPKGLGPNEWCILPNAIDPSELTEFLDGSFSCGDKGGSLGSKKGAFNDHYITKMNFYLNAGSIKDVKLVSDGEDPSNFSLRFEELKGRQGVIKHFCTSKLFAYDERESEINRFFCAQCGSCENIKKKSDETQVFVDLCGSIISLQKNLNNLNVAMLFEAACVRAGVKPVDCYPTYSRKILEPEKLLSHYDIKKDSTVTFNPRLRGGTSETVEYENWDDKIKEVPRYQTVFLDDDLIGPDNRQKGVDWVTYLSDSLQFLSRQVLIGMCRKHFSGTSFGGKFTSEQLLFDDVLNFRFSNSIPKEEYSRASALRDYVRISEIFDKAFMGANRFYPMHAGHLVNFLARPRPTVDPQSETTIAYVTNHYSLLSHSERIKISEIVDILCEMLDEDDFKDFQFAVDGISWTHIIEAIPAMYPVYVYHAKRDYMGRIISVPYENNDNFSLLHFSDNFFKHGGYPIEQLDGAFSLAMESEHFMPNLLFAIMEKFQVAAQLRVPVGAPCPVTVQKFIDDVISMLGKNTVCCKRVEA